MEVHQSDGVPDWFWDTLDGARPNLNVLAQVLEAMSRDQLVEFARLYRDAAQAVCPYWHGPTVDDIRFSEDDTEDLCNWIVSQGKRIWLEAVAASKTLEPFVRRYWAAEAGTRGAGAWNEDVSNEAYRGYQSPAYIAYGVFAARFDEDLYEILQDNDTA
jgi:hypothetical protein